MTILRRLEFLLKLMGPTAWKTMLPATLFERTDNISALFSDGGLTLWDKVSSSHQNRQLYGDSETRRHLSEAGDYIAPMCYSEPYVVVSWAGPW